MIIIVWFLSLIIFSWCYSTLFTCLKNIRFAPKASIVLYIIIISALYLVAYFWLPSKYFNDIIICSIISAILSFLTTKNELK